MPTRSIDTTTSSADGPVPDDRWHARTPDQVAEVLGVDPMRGLTGAEAAQRLAIDGPNELERDEQTPWWRVLLSQFTSPLITILLVAMVVTIVIDELVDAAVIAAVLVINAVIGFTQERKADRSVHALMDLAAPQAVVHRDGRQHEIDARTLVVGDVVSLTSGTRVPADLRLVAATALEVDESLLTGESLVARKGTRADALEALPADRRSMVFLGTTVASGRGRGLVVATGARTELGRIAEDIRTERRPTTPLQQRMHRFANIIALAVLGSTVVAFALGVALGGAVDEMFLTAVALAVAVVPEGLPVAFTVAMALGVHRMAQRGAIIRSLPAVETLGSTDVIGSDKTGTLTANRMTVRALWTPDGPVQVTRPGEHPSSSGIPDATDRLQADPHGPMAQTLRTGILSNEAQLDIVDGVVTTHHGDPTESALLEVAHHLGIDPATTRSTTRELAVVPFESERGMASVVVDEDGPVQRVKGAPERVVERCAAMATSTGPRPIDVAVVLDAADGMARQGLRVLAMAQRRLAGTAGSIDPSTPPEVEELELTGLVGMQDPPRPGVHDAIERVQQAGIRVIMITGDHVATARAIAADLGIGVRVATTATAPSGDAAPGVVDEDDAGLAGLDGTDAAGTVASADRAGAPGTQAGHPPQLQAMTGRELEDADDDQLRSLVRRIDVFARVTPEHKLRVVRALHANDQVVAVTGDGVNDGPALKAADIGVAMGRSGTDVAREASDMVLTDDAFVSIANAVEEGRVVFDNVRKVTYFLLSTGVASIVAILASIATGLPLPYVPAALLWLNVVTNGLQDVALAFEPGEPDVLDHPPRSRHDGIVTAVLWERTALTGVTMALGSLWLFTWAIDAGLSPDQQRGAALTTLVVAMAAHVYNARSERRSILRTHVRGNRFLLIATLVALTIHLGASYWAPTRFVLQIAPVTAEGWVRIGAVSIAVIAVSEAHKALRSRGVGRRRARPRADRPTGSPGLRRRA